MVEMFKPCDPAFRKAIVAKFLLRGSKSVRDIAKENDISTAAIYNWVRKLNNSGEMLMIEEEMSPDHRNVEEKAALVFSYEKLQEESKGEFLRTNGVTSIQLRQWKDAMISGIVGKNSSKITLEIQVRKLEKELLRKDRALAETAALLVLQKKIQFVYSSEDE